MAKATPDHRIKALILDYETTVYNKIMGYLRAEERSDPEAAALVRQAQSLHEGLMGWYTRSLTSSPMESHSPARRKHQ